jgi:RNA polymerase sigma-70 factor (ECF subfamily)
MAAPDPARSGRPVWRKRAGSDELELDAVALRELAQRFSRRDAVAFESVFRAFKSAIYAIGVVELGDPNEAEDLVQETFRRAWTAAGSLVEPDKLRPWLYAIARNLCADMKESQRRRPQPVEIVPEPPPRGPSASPFAAAVRAEKAQKLQSLLDSVPEQFRTVLAMRLLEERGYEEIAGILDVPIHFVKNAIARGGRILVEKIRNHPTLSPRDES